MITETNQSVDPAWNTPAIMANFDSQVGVRQTLQRI